MSPMLRYNFRYTLQSCSIYRLLPFLGLIMFLATGCGSKKKDAKNEQNKGPQELKAEAVIIKPTELISQYQSTGNLLANEAINVYAEVAGRITEIRFKEGSI